METKLTLDWLRDMEKYQLFLKEELVIFMQKCLLGNIQFTRVENISMDKEPDKSGKNRVVGDMVEVERATEKKKDTIELLNKARFSIWLARFMGED